MNFNNYKYNCAKKIVSDYAEEVRLKSIYNFDVLKHCFKFNQRTQSTPYKF